MTAEAGLSKEARGFAVTTPDPRNPFAGKGAEGLFPADTRFAFTIIDDTDVATRENAEPFYDLLYDLGMRATKTVWPLACPEGSKNFSLSETLEDPDYLVFVEKLIRRGFEVTWHGATMESSRTERTVLALERFHELFGEYPSIHVNHALNQENLYWGPKRVDSPSLRWLLTRSSSMPPNFYSGEKEDSKFGWGSHAERHIRYARNLTFSDINTLKKNPSMPYHDPQRPLIRRWFSASDADNVVEFNALLSEKNQDRLERESGACIVATHIGKGFASGGKVHSETRRLLERLARKNAWFPTVTGLLDRLAQRNSSGHLPSAEWRRMQWSWARDLVKRKVAASMRGRS